MKNKASLREIFVMLVLSVLLISLMACTKKDLKNSDGDYVYNTGELVCKLSNRLTKTLNEDKLLEIAKKHALNNLIKTKEYVDTDILEDLMYKGQIPDDIKAEIAECIQVKTTPTLTVKALTKKGDN